MSLRAPRPRHALVLASLLAVACGGGGSSGGGGGGLKTLSGPQTGTVTVVLASGAVQITNPQAVNLSGTAVVDDAADTVTLSLTVTNKSTTLLTNPKVVVDSLSEGTTAGDGTFGPAPPPADGGSPPFYYYGPESLDSNGSASRDILITGVTGVGANLVIDLEVVFHPWLFVPGNWKELVGVDSSGSGEGLLYDVTSLGFQGTVEGPLMSFPDGHFQPELASPDGRLVHFIARNQPAILTLDLVTMLPSLTNLSGGGLAFDGTGAVGSTSGLTRAPDGSMYAVLNLGAHNYRFSNLGAADHPPPLVQLVHLDADLTPLAGLELQPQVVLPPVGPGSHLEYRGRKLSLSADGSRGAVPLTDLGEIVWIDLDAFSVIDTDAVTSGVQNFDVSATSSMPRLAAVSPDGSEIAVAYVDGDGSLDVIDTSTGAISLLVPPSVILFGDPMDNTYPTFLEYGPDGRLYYGRKFNNTITGLSIYDPVAMTWVEQTAVVDAAGLAFGDGVYCAYDSDSQTVRCFDLTTDAPVQVPATGLETLSALGNFGHGMVLAGVEAEPVL